MKYLKIRLELNNKQKTLVFKRFFKKSSSFPTFKKKGIKDSFYLEGNIQATEKYIKIPIFGKVKLSYLCPNASTVVPTVQRS